jgi:transcriptional regulator with XRE-family HTH domain
MEQARGGHARFDEEQGFYADLGARIRRARGPLPQQSVARAVGLSRASVANIEAGRQQVSSWTLVRLANIFGVQAVDLLPSHDPGRFDIHLDLRGLDAAERRFVNAVSRKIETTDAETKSRG